MCSRHSREGRRMSVLVEGLTLVVRRDRLDAQCPGGAGEFLACVSGLETPPRFVCAGDRHFVNLGLAHIAQAGEIASLLTHCGLVGEDDTGAVDFVVMDDEMGAHSPCSWLRWARRPEGFVEAWRAGRRPGKLVAPTGWAPPEPTAAEHGESLFKLADDEGFATFLNLQTGAVIQEPKEEGEAMDVGEPATPVFDVLQAAIADREWIASYPGGSAAHVEFTANDAIYSARFYACEAASVLTCCIRMPVRVPKKMLRKTMEFVTRVNYGTLYGSFEIDLEGGWIFHRASLDIEGGTASPMMVANLAYAGLHSMDRYVPALLGVIHGRIPVLEALRKAER